MSGRARHLTDALGPPMRARGRLRAGFTLAETLVASVVGALIAGGTMMAFVSSARMMQDQDSAAIAEATWYVHETAERFRNRIACATTADPRNWYDAVCNPTLPAGWQQDSLPVSGGSESILSSPGAKRCYQVTQNDCDEDGVNGDCLAIQVRICWNGSACPC